jgi:hypothetical protein
MEEWKKIENTNYSVSSLGQIRNENTNCILVKRKQTLGYHSVQLGRTKQYLVHRLVIEAFIGKSPESGMVVDHINRNKTDNNISNLRWVTRAQNAQNQEFNHITFVVCITRQGQRFRKSFKTLEEAETFKNHILETYPIINL